MADAHVIPCLRMTQSTFAGLDDSRLCQLQRVAQLLRDTDTAVTTFTRTKLWRELTQVSL